MKTRPLTITFKIPSWVPTRRQLLRYKKQVKLFFFPPRCGSCNCKLPVEYPLYYKHRAGNHMGVDTAYSEFAVYATDNKCAACLKQYIHQMDLDIGIGACDLCNRKNTKVVGYHNNLKGIIITFLWQFWNGRSYCLPCVDDLLDTGNVKDRYQF